MPALIVVSRFDLFLYWTTLWQKKAPQIVRLSNSVTKMVTLSHTGIGV